MSTIVEATEHGTQSMPRFINSAAYRCLRVGDIAGFHHYSSEDEVIDLSDADLRSVDLRKVDLTRVLLRGAYLKEADLRGQDLRNHDLEGCSLRNAKVGGVYFPENVRSEELLMSLQHGTRIRVRSRS